jgi:hypothetical protein
MDRMLLIVSGTTTAGMEKPMRVDREDDRTVRMGSIGPMVLLSVDDIRYATRARGATVGAAGLDGRIHGEIRMGSCSLTPLLQVRHESSM